MLVHSHLRSWPIKRTYALTEATVCWAGFFLIAFLTFTGRMETFDTLGLQYWRNAPYFTLTSPGWLQEAARDVTALGGVLLRNLFAAAAVVALFSVKLRREAVVLAGTVISGWMMNTAIKALVHRPRPDIVPHLTEAAGPSFPSGHSFNSAVVFIAITLAFAAMISRKHVRWVMIGSSIGLTWLIALSRVWLGVHFPSDVIAGWLGGAAWAFSAAVIFEHSARKEGLNTANTPLNNP